MKRMTTLFAVVATMLFGVEAQAQATTSDADVRTELRALAADAETAAQADRRVVRTFLEHQDVREVAQAQGVDLEEARRALETLDDEVVADLADRVQETQQDLDQVGGDTLVISSTAIIIALLVILVIVLA